MLHMRAQKYFQCAVTAAVFNPVAHNEGRKLTENFPNFNPYGPQRQLPNMFETEISAYDFAHNCFTNMFCTLIDKCIWFSFNHTDHMAVFKLFFFPGLVFGNVPVSCFLCQSLLHSTFLIFN